MKMISKEIGEKMHIKTIASYQCKNEQEKVDQATMLEFARHNDDSLLRSNKIAHFTNSAIITNKTKDKVLFVYHLIYKSWSWVGGHNDGNPNFLEVVLKEAAEETGVTNVKPLLDEPVALDNIYVPGHIKNGLYVGDHIHMNLSYLLIADEKEELIINENENSGVKWFDLEDVLNYVSEERMLYIYKKIFKVLRDL